jgi:hypothetical protein
LQKFKRLRANVKGTFEKLSYFALQPAQHQGGDVLNNANTPMNRGVDKREILRENSSEDALDHIEQSTVIGSDLLIAPHAADQIDHHQTAHRHQNAGEQDADERAGS